MVEHAASGRFDQLQRGDDDGTHHAAGPAADGGRLLGLFGGGGTGAGALPDRRTRRTREARMTQAGAHLLFIVAAYAVPVLLLAFEVWQLARRTRGQAPPQEAEDEA